MTSRIRRFAALVLLASPLQFTCAQSSDQSNAVERIDAWAAKAAEVRGLRAKWQLRIPVRMQDQLSPRGFARVSESTLYRWPDCFRRERRFISAEASTEHAPLAHAEIAGLHELNDRDDFRRPDGVSVLVRTRAQSVDVSRAIPSVLERALVHAVDSPLILALFIVHNKDAIKISRRTDNAIEVMVASQGGRAIFKELGSDLYPAAIEFLGHDAQVALSYAFDDFRTVKDLPWPIAHRRVMQMPDSPEQVDTLAEMVILASPSNEQFTPATVGPTARPVPTDAEAIAKAESGQRSTERSTALQWSAVGVCAVVGAGLVVLCVRLIRRHGR